MAEDKEVDMNTDLDLYKVMVEAQFILGTADMDVQQVLNLGRGAVLKLDQKFDQQIDMIIEGKKVAHGLIVAEDEGVLGVEISQVLHETVDVRQHNVIHVKKKAAAEEGEAAE